MDCERCGGLLLIDQVIETAESAEPKWRCVWRCLDCGDAVDPITLANRRIEIIIDQEILFGSGLASDVV